MQLARAPEWSGSASLEHRFALPNGASLVASASSQFTASRWISVDFTPQERAPSYVTGNFDLSYSPQGGRWLLTGFVHNLSNAFILTGGAQQLFAPPQAYATVDPPRTYGGRIIYNF